MRCAFFIMLFALTACAQARVNVFYPESHTESDLKTLVKQFPKEGHIILGEFHNDHEIQRAEADIINLTLKENRTAQASVSWEFLDHVDQVKITNETEKLKAAEISPEKFLKTFFTVDQSTYVPVLEAVRDQGLDLYGVNVPRIHKQKLIKDGLDSLPREIVPPNMWVGDEQYFERFSESMRGHVPKEKIGRYFEAQCLTDSVMAHQLSQRAGLSFLIAGSFHTDYYAGTVARLKKLSKRPVTVIKIINANELSEFDIEEIKTPHPIYGPVADAVVIID